MAQSLEYLTLNKLYQGWTEVVLKGVKHRSELVAFSLQTDSLLVFGGLKKDLGFRAVLSIDGK